MEVLVLAFLVLVGFLVAVRASVHRPVRAVPLLLSGTATVIFVAVRNHYDLEETRFLWGLVASCGAACLGTFTATLIMRQSPGRSANYGAVAGALVLPLLVAYYILLVLSCLITGCDME